MANALSEAKKVIIYPIDLCLKIYLTDFRNYTRSLENHHILLYPYVHFYELKVPLVNFVGIFHPKPDRFLADVNI